MGLTDTVFGKPGTTTVHQTPATRDPGFGPARDFFNSLLGISKTPFPTFQGSIDPGLSPTMMDVIRRAQGFAGSGAPEILAGAQGSLGRFMNPSFLNPITRLFGGAPDYSGIDPSQRVFGGGPAGDQTFYGRSPSYMGGGGNYTSTDGGGYMAEGDPMQSMNGGGFQTPGFVPPFPGQGGWKGGGPTPMMREGGVSRPLGGSPSMGFKPAPTPGGGMQFGRPNEPSQGGGFGGGGVGAAAGPSFGAKPGAPNPFQNSGRFAGGFNFPGKTPPFPGGGMQSMFKSASTNASGQQVSPGGNSMGGGATPMPAGQWRPSIFANTGDPGAGGGVTGGFGPGPFGGPRFEGPPPPSWGGGGAGGGSTMDEVARQWQLGGGGAPSMGGGAMPSAGLGFGGQWAIPGGSPSMSTGPTPMPQGPQASMPMFGQGVPDLQDYQGTAGPGVQTAYDQGNVKNRGMVRQGPNGPEILVGGGGGESVKWEPYDPNNYGHQQNSQMFNRYGSNWTSGARYGGGHSTDIPNQFQLATGRQPTQQEQYDIYYGVNKIPPFPGAQG